MNSEFKGSVLPGELFNQFFTENYIVLQNEDGKIDYNTISKEGLNEKELKITNNNYAFGGIDFYSESMLLENASSYYFPTHFRYVTKIENDANIYVTDNKFQVNKIHLSDAKDLSELSIWKNKLFCKEAINKDVKYIKYATDVTEEMCIDIVKDKPHMIDHLPLRTDNINLEAVKRNSWMIKYVPKEDQHKQICWIAFIDNFKTFEHIHCQDEQMNMIAVTNDGLLLKYVKKQTFYICMAAIKQNGAAIEFVIEQTSELCNLACSKKISFIKYCKYQDKSIVLDILNKDPLLLKYILNQDLEICKVAVYKNYLSFKYAKIQDEEMCLKALSKDGMLIKYVLKQTPNICKLALESNNNAFEFIKNINNNMIKSVLKVNGLQLQNIEIQNYDMCLEAVKNNWKAMEYVKKEYITDDNYIILCEEAFSQSYDAIQFCKYQSHNMILNSVMNNCMNLKYIKNQTKELCNIAFEYNSGNNYRAIMYVQSEFQSEELCLKAVLNDGLLLEYINNPSEAVQVEAVYQNSNAFKFVKEPSEKVFISFVSDNGFNLKDIDDQYQTEYICKAAVLNNAYSIKYATVQNEEICQISCAKSIHNLEYCTVRTPNLLKKICNENGAMLRELTYSEKTYDICLISVSNCGASLEYVPKCRQTVEICLAAIKNNGDSLEYVKQDLQTYEMVLIAIKESGSAIEYCKEELLTDELCLIAVKDMAYNLKVIKNPSKIVLKEAFKNSSYAINHLDPEKQTISTKLLAVSQKESSIVHLENECNEFYLMAFLVNPKIEQFVGNINTDAVEYVSRHPYLQHIKDSTGRQKIELPVCDNDNNEQNKDMVFDDIWGDIDNVEYNKDHDNISDYTYNESPYHMDHPSSRVYSDFFKPDDSNFNSFLDDIFADEA